ncbi:MAG: hypothetical protein ABL925_16890, partial [Methylococcales bacterium]
HVVSNDQTTSLGKIKQLETEIAQKDQQLQAYQCNMQFLHDALKKSLYVINTLESQLKSSEAQLLLSGKRIDEVISALQKDNTKLKLTNDIWLNRAIKLELEVLAANKRTKQVEVELALTINKMRLLQGNLTNYN